MIGTRSRHTLARIGDYSNYLSPLGARRRPSAIRRLMPLMSKPGMISLGGGLPNSGMFPFKALRFDVEDNSSSSGAAVSISLSKDELREALQYSPTPGLPRLVKSLEELQVREHGLKEGGDFEVTVTVGSQDGLTKAFEMLIDPTCDELLVEDPTYSGALAFLHPFGCTLTPVSSDGNGIIPKDLHRILKSNDGGRPGHNRVLYTIPTAQNPGGTTLTNDRRKRIYDLAQKYDLIIVEDDPYYFLHPERDEIESFLSLDTDGRVIRFDSLSKLISSGIRIGFATGPKVLMERINLHIQATNLHNSGLSQAVTAALLDYWGEGGFNLHARKVADFYMRRRDALLFAAERHLKGIAEWHVPEAGMFLWIKLRGISDTKSLIEEKAAEANVLFVPGQSFSPLDKPSPYVRASYSTASDKDMDLAMKRLASLIRKEIGSSFVA